MSTEEAQFELFENYLGGTLSSEENTAFDKKLTQDDAFKKAFDLYRDVSAYIAHDISEEKQSFTDTLAKVGDRYFSEPEETHIDDTIATETKKPKVIKMRPMYYSMAAAVALLIGFFIYQNNGNVVPGDFKFSENISITERGDTLSTVSLAETSFNKKAYQEAINHFTTLLLNDPNNAQLQFYKAVSHDAILQFDEADALFSILTNGNSTYKYKASFYNGISQWKQQNNTSAKKLLSSIPQTSELYKKAQKALKNID